MTSSSYGKWMNVNFRSTARTFCGRIERRSVSVPRLIAYVLALGLLQSTCISLFLTSPLFTTLLSYLLSPNTRLSHSLARSRFLIRAYTLLSLPINLMFCPSLAFLWRVGGVVVGARSVRSSPGRAEHSVLQ